MPIPVRQNIRVASYLMRQKLAKREKYPLIVEIEPLFACNLSCPGCGKIQHPTEILRRRLSVEDETEIDLSWLAAARTVGITAGASAPDHLVHRVVDRLACLGATTVVERNGHHEDVHFSLPPEVR